MLEGVLECGNQSLILGEIVRLVSEIFAESCDFAAGLVLDNDAIARRAGISARASVAVRNQVMPGRIFPRFE